ANRDQCEIDLLDWTDTLDGAARTLRRHGVPFLFMNTPLCALPRALWQTAHRSISDWKNVYADECDRCTVKAQCAGLFAWHDRGWKPTRIRAIEQEVV
ncbi:MAG: His-Xaa-Ser system radical SAM maturase HxsC, partial [Methylibium sp.]